MYREITQLVNKPEPSAWRRRLDGASVASLRASIALIVLVMMGTMISRGSYAGSGDAIHYLQIAHSVAFDHDFDLRNDYRDPSNIIQLAPEQHAIPGRHGVLRPVHDIGLPVVAAPVFAVAYRLAEATRRLPAALQRRLRLTPFIALRQLMSLFMIAVTAVLAIVFFDAARALSGDQAAAFLWTLLWTLSSPILSHGSVFFTEVPSALVALFVFSRRGRLTGPAPVRDGLLLGLLTGFLVLLHVRNIGIVLALVMLIAWRTRRELRPAAAFAVGLAAMAVVKVILDVRFWGTIITTPQDRVGAWSGLSAFAGEMFVRAGGLLFDPRHGLLWSAPLYLLAPAAWWLLRRQRRREAGDLLVVVAAYLFFVLLPLTNAHGWRGGWAPPARFLVPIVPFLALALPLLPWQGSARLALRIIVAVQVVLDVFFWLHPMQFWSEGPGPAPFLDALIGRDASALIPVWRTPTVELAGVFVLSLAVWAIVTVWLCACLRPRV